MIQGIIEICKPNPITLRDFIGKSTSSLAFIIADNRDMFGNNPIYECFSLNDFINMPKKIGNRLISRFSVKEAKNGVTYIIVNTYEEEHHETR